MLNYFTNLTFSASCKSFDAKTTSGLSSKYFQSFNNWVVFDAALFNSLKISQNENNLKQKKNSKNIN